MRGYATQPGDDSGFMAPMVGETRVIAGVPCTFVKERGDSEGSYVGSNADFYVNARWSGWNDRWYVALGTRRGVWASACESAADLDDAAEAALRTIAALTLLYTFCSLARTAVAS